MLRILLAPVLAVAMQVHSETSLAALVFAAGMTTDVADGYMARSHGRITKFGTLMDPIADKLFVGTALVCLAITGQIPIWVVVIIFARDLFVTGMRFAARRQGVIIAASRMGKAKTVVQAIVVMVLLVTGTETALIQALVYGMVAITVFSGAQYAAGYLRGRRRVAVPRVARPRRSAPARASGSPGPSSQGSHSASACVFRRTSSSSPTSRCSTSG